MDEKALAANINTAINELIKLGPTPELLTRWRAELERSLDDAATSPQAASDALKCYYQDFLDRIIQCKGMPVREITSTSVGHDTRLKGIGMEDNFDSLEPKIRYAFDVCVEQAQEQAESFRQHQIIDALDTFCEWAHSIPVGGTKEKTFREDARDVRNELKAASKWDRYYSQEKSGNFLSAVNRIEAEGNGAIAAEWSCSSWANEEEHQQYDGKVYLVRGNWASEKGLIDDSRTRYIDELPEPGSDGCMCTYHYLFNLNRLPPELITPKGTDAIATSGKARRDWEQSRSAPQAIVADDPPYQNNDTDSVDIDETDTTARAHLFKRYKHAVALALFLIIVGILATRSNLRQSPQDATAASEIGDQDAAASQKMSDELNAANARVLRSTPAETPIPDAKADIVNVSAIQLASEYDANEVATDEKYRGVTLHVFGTVHSIEKDFRDKIVIALNTGSGLGHALMGMTDDQKGLVMQLNKGDTITIECQKIRSVLGAPSGSKCRIVPDNERTQSGSTESQSASSQPSNLISNEEIHKQGNAALSRKDYAEAMRLFTQEAQNGSAEGQTSLGFMYYKGLGAPVNGPEAMRWLRQAADTGLPRAQYNIGAIYEYGYGFPVDYLEAMRWYRKAADQGYAPAQFNIAELYEFGAGVDKDEAQARNWYDLAAAQGFGPAKKALDRLVATPTAVNSQSSQSNQN